jgi:hypothetical protein
VFLRIDEKTPQSGGDQTPTVATSDNIRKH